MSVHEHKKEAPRSVRCAVITVSDTRTEETDKSGKLIKELLQAHGHSIEYYEMAKDDGETIQAAFVNAIRQPEVQAVIVNGGTGIAKRDVTIETLVPLFDKEIVGFGELFRMISYTEDIGSAAMLSRAAAGVCQDKAVFITPGSSGAVKLAMKKLILNELGHIIREIQK
ncbi:molybdenum cofactor biosynthesis protein B [Siminovitchia sp. FSL H7-0308]|uniref:Molybdenum cofactor biosynthesis protein B n=1 Tax=Siminovitchia thermophila TaxID=1245522 RepID=A0ABS2R7U7_9BACI|nr:molybdenum cofactor biosynthesis protein B [Siminovitchia thermophila]MBM7715209.1 molybdenum cofactor biosynthesis protein B [Siminovitchia thermophila]ONK24058.1 molybdenum cofactor biosynthesis protein [Bacillus sp. VT-16-64]